MNDNNIFNFPSHPTVRLIPERLKEAREANELTMAELGSRVGITRQAISLYESGERTPDSDIMIKITEELSQPLSYFTSDRPSNFGQRQTIFFRSFKSKTKRTNKKCEVFSNWFGQTAAYFNQFINFPAVSLPEVAEPGNGSRYTEEEIENIATQCRRHWGLGDGPIANVVSLLESKGIIVSRAEFGTKSVDAFSFWDGARPFIFLGADKSSACRSRFDAAHELGHIIMHRGLSDIEVENDLTAIENEANRFASSFLLPASTYSLEVFSTRLSAFLELKKRWKVSIAAQIYRTNDLKLLTDDQVLNLRKQLSSNKWTRREPLDDELPVEAPKIMEKCLNILIESHVKHPSEILNDVRLSEVTIENLLSISWPKEDKPTDPTDQLFLKT